MRFQLQTFIGVFACINGLVSAAEDFELYAYGTGLQTGLKLFYGDGQAYVGLKAPSFASQAANITLSFKDTKLVVSSDSLSTQPLLYIGADIDSDNLKCVRFAQDEATIPAGAIVSGFGLFGGGVYNNKNTAALQMKFVATPTTEKEVYRVKWNNANTQASGTNVPISLRTEAPIIIQN